MSCFGIERKVTALRARQGQNDWGGSLRGACWRKHVAAVKRERLMIAVMRAAGQPMTLAELVSATGESFSSVYSTVMRLRGRGLLVSAQRGGSRAHAHTVTAGEAA